MTNTPIVRSYPQFGSLVIVAGDSTTIACLRCGHPKGVYTLFGAHKDSMFHFGTCICTYAPNPGGETQQHDESSDLRERRIVAGLHACTDISAIHAKIRQMDTLHFSDDLQDLLDKLLHCRTVPEVQAAIIVYSTPRMARSQDG